MNAFEMIPLIQMALILCVSILSPLVSSRTMKWTLGISLGVNLILGGALLDLVHTTGPFSIQLGGYLNTLGIELVIDSFSALFTVFVTGFGLLVHLYSVRYVNHALKPHVIASYYGLLALLYFGVFGLLYTNDLFNTYVFIEILSITTCAIISVARKKRNFMAAFRYLMLNELGSISFLLGIALLYMVTGSLNMSLIQANMASAYALYPVNITLAFGFIGVGLAMKSAIFPFHEWLPDAHASAPAPSSALLSGVVVKLYLLVMVKMIFRVFGVDIVTELNVPFVMMVFASAAMLMGSVFALGQTDIKRMLAYSTVSQVGYMVLALSLVSITGLTAMFFYILSHAFLKGTLFLVTGATIYRYNKRSLKDYEGLGYTMPLTMGAFAIAAFGMVGIPGTSGFIAKFDLAIAFLDRSQFVLVGLLMVSGILNAIYYFPIVAKAFVTENDGVQLKLETLPKSMIFVLIVFTGAIFVLGFAPNLVMPYIEAAAHSMGGIIQ